MNKDFISKLCSHCTEDLVFMQDVKQSNYFAQLEQEFISGMGYDFVMQYQAAAGEIHAQEFEAAFLKGLQFSAQFMLTVLPPQSSRPSAPNRRRAAEMSSQP